MWALPQKAKSDSRKFGGRKSPQATNPIIRTRGEGDTQEVGCNGFFETLGRQSSLEKRNLRIEHIGGKKKLAPEHYLPRM